MRELRLSTAVSLDPQALAAAAERASGVCIEVHNTTYWLTDLAERSNRVRPGLASVCDAVEGSTYLSGPWAAWLAQQTPLPAPDKPLQLAIFYRPKPDAPTRAPRAAWQASLASGATRAAQTAQTGRGAVATLAAAANHSVPPRDNTAAAANTDHCSWPAVHTLDIVSSIDVHLQLVRSDCGHVRANIAADNLLWRIDAPHGFSVWPGTDVTASLYQAQLGLFTPVVSRRESTLWAHADALWRGYTPLAPLVQLADVQNTVAPFVQELQQAGQAATTDAPELLQTHLLRRLEASGFAAHALPTLDVLGRLGQAICLVFLQPEQPQADALLAALQQLLRQRMRQMLFADASCAAHVLNDLGCPTRISGRLLWLQATQSRQDLPAYAPKTQLLGAQALQQARTYLPEMDGFLAFSSVSPRFALPDIQITAGLLSRGALPHQPQIWGEMALALLHVDDGLSHSFWQPLHHTDEVHQTTQQLARLRSALRTHGRDTQLADALQLLAANLVMQTSDTEDGCAWGALFAAHLQADEMSAGIELLQRLARSGLSFQQTHIEAALPQGGPMLARWSSWLRQALPKAGFADAFAADMLEATVRLNLVEKTSSADAAQHRGRPLMKTVQQLALMRQLRHDGPLRLSEVRLLLLLQHQSIRPAAWHLLQLWRKSERSQCRADVASIDAALAQLDAFFTPPLAPMPASLAPC